MICDCGARAIYRTSDGDLCGPCYRASRPDVYAPPLLVIPVEAGAPRPATPPTPRPVVSIATPPPAESPKPRKPYSRAPLPPKPADLAPYAGIAIICRRCQRERRLKARELCASCYSYCHLNNLMDVFAAPTVPGWQRAAAAESVRVRAARRAVATADEVSHG